MSRESKVSKERTCQECKRVYFMTAAELKGHANVCKRAKAAGIVLPEIKGTGVTLVNG